jgi:hypothetical protein
MAIEALLRKECAVNAQIRKGAGVAITVALAEEIPVFGIPQKN